MEQPQSLQMIQINTHLLSEPIIQHLMNLINKKFKDNEHFQWNQLEEKVNKRFNELKLIEEQNLPDHFFQKDTTKHHGFMKTTKLYSVLDKMPKGTTHHIHLDCNEDIQFLKTHVFNYPGVYITVDLKSWKYGSHQEALKQGWKTVEEVRKMFETEAAFEKAILKMTQFQVEQIEELSYKTTTWQIFEGRIAGFFDIYYQQELHKKFVDHMCRMYIRNGYNRVEVRAPLFPLRKRIDENNPKSYTTVERVIQIGEEVEKEIQADYPNFSLGYVIFALKMFTPQELDEYVRKVYSIHSHIIIGIDLVQQEQKYPHFEEYEPVLRKIQQDFKDIKVLVGVFHAGETKNMKNKNVAKVADYGSVRIGHATNLFQHAYLIDYIKEKDICIEVCPLSNQLLGYVYDLTQHPAIAYYHLGIAISINSDDPARFGYNCNTPDYLVSCLGFGFDLKDYKLLGIYSVEHSICPEPQKAHQLKLFLSQWDHWIQQLVI